MSAPSAAPPPPDSSSTPPPTAATPPPPDSTSTPPPPVSPAASPPKSPATPPVSPPVVPPVVSPPPVSPPPQSPPPAAPPPQSPPPTAPPPRSPPTVPPPTASPPPPPDLSPPPSDPSPPPPSNPSPPPPSDLSPPPPSRISPPPPSNPSPPPSPVTPILSPPPQLLSPPPPYEPPPPQSASSSSKSSSVSTGLVAGIAAGSVIGVALLIAILFLLFRKRRRNDDSSRYRTYYQSPSPIDRPFIAGPMQQSSWQTPTPSMASSHTKHSSESRPPSGPNPPVPPIHFGPAGAYNYEDLQFATDGFSESNVLGQGGFGVVYQGTLSGKEVAIKKLKSGGGQGDREFRAEVEIISRVHHKNLVSLVGYCLHEEQRLLVYEFVPNKTLDFHLHGGSGRPTLDWLRRWKIALGSAKGLAYLHEDCDPKIIHRDVKASNILLDYNFEPKVADFGLAKLVPENVTHVSTQIMGTFGYLAPEYATSGKLTDRSDVYSYGVMLLELITGRKPIMGSNPRMDDLMDPSLVNWAKPLLQRATKEEMYDELIDPWLETNYDQYDMARLIHCAAAAVRDSARKRPRMGQIVRYLEGEISLEDLNAGMIPGNSNLKANSAQEAVLRRMAFGGIISEDYAESDQTSEYDPTASSAYTEETEDHRVTKKRSGEM